MKRAEILAKIGERKMPMLTRTKTIAALIERSVKNTKRWSKKLNVPPDVIGHGSHRWEWCNAWKLIRRLRKYQAKHKAAAGWRGGKKYPV